VSGMQQVHVRVTDAATGQPTPVRLCVNGATAPDNEDFFMPLGRPAIGTTIPYTDIGGRLELETPTWWEAWAYIDGGCEINLPCHEPLRLRAAKGPEYVPLEVEFQLQRGKLALRHEVRRWSDIRQAGWYGGDARVHCISPHAALLEAQAEDLAVVQILIREYELPDNLFTSTVDALARKLHLPDDFFVPSVAYPNMLAFSGQTPCLQVPGHFVVVNSENFHPELGNLGLLHCHRVVYPLSFGVQQNDEENWTLLDWCGQCHRKNGLVVWTQTLHRCEDFFYGEPLVDLLLGEVDAFELTDDGQAALPLWYDLLSIGVRVPLAGASGKESNAQILGALRTYVKLEAAEELTCSSWIEGLRAGRTFVTNGPLVEFTVNGQPPGSVVHVEAGNVRLRAEAKSWQPFERLEIVCGGATVAAAAAQSGQPAHAILEADVPIERSAWLAARCTGDTFAHTSPIYVEVAGRPMPPDRDAAARLLCEVERMIAWCQTKARCPTPQTRDRLLAGFIKARERLRAVGR